MQRTHLAGAMRRRQGQLVTPDQCLRCCLGTSKLRGSKRGLKGSAAHPEAARPAAFGCPRLGHHLRHFSSTAQAPALRVVFRKLPVHSLDETRARHAEALAVRVHQSVQLARQQRVGALAVLLGQALERRHDLAWQPRREPARPHSCRQDEHRIPPQRVLDGIDRPDIHGLLRQLVNVDHRPAAARRRLDLARPPEQPLWARHVGTPLLCLPFASAVSPSEVRFLYGHNLSLIRCEGRPRSRPSR
jgi:hypothetical protein